DEYTAKNAYAKLIPHATLWTPNLDEAAFFLDHTSHDAKQIAINLFNMFQTPVLLKGGHGDTQQLQDILCMAHDEVSIFEHPKQDISSEKLHGTGCRLASAIAAYIAHQHPVFTAIKKAHIWLQIDLESLQYSES
ncbi:MAG: bifunctional hydroxymethylpyrimidine kinase/phosphomethylpyrimidine kinase, partial [Ghiorsea sp.]|nr:bifunctional hydroxymethylpyrimidine kinase/phosphomethylpyrimidine kinase [Ghiorsea sp.]